MPKDQKYTTLHLSQAVAVNECIRCGAVIFHRTIHDDWHERNDRYEAAVFKILIGFRSKIKRIQTYIQGAVNEKNTKQSSRQRN